MESGPLVYCSGPLFSPEEMAAMAHIAAVLESAGHRTFLPQRDGLEAYVLRHAGHPLASAWPISRIRSVFGRAIFALDVYQCLERCDALVFNMNGRVPDEGAVAETALAWASGRPLVIYKRDDRSPFHGEDNSMVTGLAYGGATIDRSGELPRAVERVIAAVRERCQEPSQAPRPPFVEDAVRRGARIWRWMELLPRAPAGETSVESIRVELERIERGATG